MGSARDYSADSLAAFANDTAELGRLELRAARHFNRLRAHGDSGKVFLRRADHLATLVGNRGHNERNDPGGDDESEYYRAASSRGASPGHVSMKCLMAALIIGPTRLDDWIHSFELSRR